MTVAQADTAIERIRKAIAVVTEADFSRHTPEQPLNLDSIARISLIAEMENVFGLELSEDDTKPEAFECLASLAAMIEARLA